MQKFYIDNEGNFLGGFDGCVPENGTEVSSQPMDGRQKYVNGAWQPLSSAQTYAENRAKEYPPLGEQLDMLWHAMDEGALPKIEPFYTQIKVIKDKYSKA